MQADAVFRNIASIAIDALSKIRDIEYRKILFLEVSNKIKEIKWKGVSVLIERLFDQLLAEEESAIIIACGIRFICKINPEKARRYANELLLRIEDLSPFRWDRAMALIYSADALLELDNEIAEKMINKAMIEAEAVPDRSDRSDAFAKLIPVLYKLGKRKEIKDVYEKIVYYPRKVEVAISLTMINCDKEILKEILRALDEKDKLLINSFLARNMLKENPEIAKRMIEEIIEKMKSMSIPDFEKARILANAFYVYNKMDISKVRFILEELKEIIIRHGSEPHFVALAFELPVILLEFGQKEKALTLTSELVKSLLEISDAREFLILSNAAYCYSRLGEFEKAYEYLNRAYAITQRERFIAPMIDICSTSFAIMNEFPESVPISLAEEFADKILGIKRIRLELELTEDNFSFLQAVFKGNIQQGLNKLLSIARYMLLHNIEEKAIKALFAILETDPTILHYIFKYVMSLRIPEGEKGVLFRIIERAIESIYANKLEKTRQFLEIIISRLSRLNIPISPAIMNYVAEYLPYMIAGEKVLP